MLSTNCCVKMNNSARKAGWLTLFDKCRSVSGIDRRGRSCGDQEEHFVWSGTCSVVHLCQCGLSYLSVSISHCNYVSLEPDCCSQGQADEDERQREWERKRELYNDVGCDFTSLYHPHTVLSTSVGCNTATATRGQQSQHICVYCGLFPITILGKIHTQNRCALKPLNFF